MLVNPSRVIPTLHARPELLVRLRHSPQPGQLLRIPLVHDLDHAIGVRLPRLLVDAKRPRDLRLGRLVGGRRILREHVPEGRREGPGVVEREAPARRERAAVGVGRVARERHASVAVNPGLEPRGGGCVRVDPGVGRRVDDGADQGGPALVVLAQDADVPVRVPRRVLVGGVGRGRVALVRAHDGEEVPAELGDEQGPVRPPEVVRLVREVRDVREVRQREDVAEGHPARPGCFRFGDEKGPHRGVDPVRAEYDVGCGGGAIREADYQLLPTVVEFDGLERLG